MPSKKSVLLSALLGTALLSVAVPLAKAQQRHRAKYTCTVTLSYVPTSGSTETYQKTFDIAAGGFFEDDFSTRTRAHVFKASAIGQGDGVLFDFDYFSDVSALQQIDLGQTLRLQDVLKENSVSGSHFYYATGGNPYTLTWDFQAVRRK